MTLFFPNGSSLFQDDNDPIHRAQAVTDWFDEHEKDLKVKYSATFALTSF